MKFSGWKKENKIGDHIYSLDLKEIQPLLQLIKRTKYIDNLDLNKIGYKKIRGLIHQIQNEFRISLLCSELPLSVFRAINYTEEINNISAIWYNPNIDSIKRGRINKPKQQLFYAASEFDNSIFEINPRVNDTVHICRCEILDNQKGLLPYLGLSNETIKSLGIQGNIEKEINNFFHSFSSNTYYNGIPLSDVSDELIILNFMHKYMAFKSNNTTFYKITNAISELVLNEEKHDGIAYPNINWGLPEKKIMSGFNYAIKPEVIDSKYKIKEIWKIKYLKEKNNNIELGFISYSNEFSDSGEIFWREIEKNQIPNIISELRGIYDFS